MMSEASVRYLAEQAERRQANLGKERARALAQLAAISYPHASECSRKLAGVSK